MYQSTIFSWTSLCFFLILFSYNSYSQEIENLHNDPIGSAGDLKGKTLIINCFISEPRREWSLEEKKATLGKEREGIKWLKAQATNWGIDSLSFEEYNIGLNNDVVVPQIKGRHNVNKIHIHWVTYALHEAGYNNVYNLYKTLKTRFNADNVVVMVFANKRGRSYAQSTSADAIGFNPESFVEGAIVYKQYLEGYELYEGTIIHEMLHLFGAWDMYHDGDYVMRSDEVERRIRGALGSSIMLKDHLVLCKANIIDPLTAWRIGWSKTYWPWYEMFRKGGTQPVWDEIPLAR